MNIWKNNKYVCESARKGLRFRFDKKVDPEVRRACLEFGAWLRSVYFFPIRINIYYKSQYKVKALDGEYVSATFFGPFSKSQEPYIKISTGDYQELLSEWGKDNALVSIIVSIAHELTHYFQWLNDNLELTDATLEKQACYYGNKIFKEYAQTIEHP